MTNLQQCRLWVCPMFKASLVPTHSHRVQDKPHSRKCGNITKCWGAFWPLKREAIQHKLPIIEKTEPTHSQENSYRTLLWLGCANYNAPTRTILRVWSWSTVQWPGQKNALLFLNPKLQTPRHKQSNIIYAIQCQEECNELYIGETKQLLQKRKAQHRPAACSGQDSAVHLHLKKAGHSFEDSRVRVLNRELLKQQSDLFPYLMTEGQYPFFLPGKCQRIGLSWDLTFSGLRGLHGPMIWRFHFGCNFLSLVWPLNPWCGKQVLRDPSRQSAGPKWFKGSYVSFAWTCVTGGPLWSPALGRVWMMSNWPLPKGLLPSTAQRGNMGPSFRGFTTCKMGQRERIKVSWVATKSRDLGGSIFVC